MKILKSITLYTQIHQFCANQPQKLLRLTIFLWKSPQKMFDSDFPGISSSSWFNVVPSLEKLCQAVVARNEQANLEPTLNNGAGGASLTIFVTDCRYQKSA